MIKVAVFDDHAERRAALEMLLGIQPDMACTGSFENCDYLEEDVHLATPDVVLMDIDMPGINGIEAVRIVRRIYPVLPVIMQTVFDDDDRIFQSIQAGANGYILKKSSPEKLIEGIRDVLAGGAPMTASIASRVLHQFRHQSRAHEASDDAHGLTSREKEILQHLGRGYSHKMVAAELDISPFTVNNHIKNIYTKLQVRSAAEVVAVALKRGIVR